MKTNIWMAALLLMASGCSTDISRHAPESLSGIYPRLATYNDEGECGTGAVVPWAGQLWIASYGPHLPLGSSDKLYAISPDMQQTIFPQSIGGTPANRMIHKESNQLFIASYAIDSVGHVRVIPFSEMPGRMTANARHLTDPAHKIYFATMEEGFYEVDVQTLAVHELYKDGNLLQQKKNDTDAGPINDLLPGVHGKGFYTGQGVGVYANNGEGSQEALKRFDVEAGSLSEWDGKQWKVVRRNQFTEVTGPGGIYGNAHPDTDPIWVNGWDYKSILVGVRHPQRGWSFYRLPKASHSYDGAHGWNTEWPRIRNVGTEENPDYLMTMHGMFWNFPATFTADNSAGIRPRSAYLKVIGDFARWNDQLVFGCDDSAQKEFLNKRKAKGNIEGPGQSNSNLWFTSLTRPDELGPATAEGAVWAHEEVATDVPSEPFLFAGWAERSAWVKNNGAMPVTFTFEVDKQGNGQWTKLKQVMVGSMADSWVPFDAKEQGEWIRVRTDRPTQTTVSFNYTTPDHRTTQADALFKGLAKGDTKKEVLGGLLYGLGHNQRTMGLLANKEKDGQEEEVGYYTLTADLTLEPTLNKENADLIRERCAIPQRVVEIDKGGIHVTDDANRRWILPVGHASLQPLTDRGALRICREVATERDLFSCMGTFFELPAENADGYAKIRPIATHPFRINDYASYRGLLVMTGVTPDEVRHNEHIITSTDGKAAVWAGAIDDLWSLGKPTGEGGPWVNTKVQRGVPSDPYLMAFYDKKQLRMTSDKATKVTVEIDPTGNGDWMVYRVEQLQAGKEMTHTFPASFAARWIRFTADTDGALLTTWLTYE